VYLFGQHHIYDVEIRMANTQWGQAAKPWPEAPWTSRPAVGESKATSLEDTGCRSLCLLVYVVL